MPEERGLVMRRMLKGHHVQRSIGGAISLLIALCTPIFALLILDEEAS